MYSHHDDSSFGGFGGHDRGSYHADSWGFNSGGSDFGGFFKINIGNG
jgi:hypothetical protein